MAHQMIRQELLRIYKKSYDYSVRKYVVSTTQYDDVNSYLFYKVSELEKLLNFVKDNQRSSIPDNNTVYFAKNATISRAKFREWARHKGIKVVLNPEKADIIILDSSKGIPSLNNFETKYLKLEVEKLTEFDNSGKLIQKEHYVYKECPSTEGTEFKVCREWELSKYLSQGFDDLMNISHALNNKSVVLVSSIVDQMNNLVMDYDAYDNVYHMLNSSDRKDQRVGLELLTNYNYKESKFFLSLLKMNVNMNSFKYNTVSLKPLEKFLQYDLSGINYCYDLSDFLRNFDHMLSSKTIEYDYVLVEQIILNKLREYTPNIPIEMIKFKRIGDEKTTSKKNSDFTVTTFE